MKIIKKKKSCFLLFLENQDKVEIDGIEIYINLLLVQYVPMKFMAECTKQGTGNVMLEVENRRCR